MPVAGAAAPHLAALRGRRIMIVDDSAGSRLALEKLLHGWGCEVLLASGGGEAQMLLRAQREAKRPLDAILIDSRMPGMDGATLAARLHAGPDLGDAPLLEMAAPQQRGGVAPPGYAGRINKPVRSDHLARLLTAALPAAQQTPILLVEDSGLNLVQLLLEKAGYGVEVVRTANAAQAALERQSYPLVLLDCDLPDLDCPAAIRRIRAASAPGAAIVILGGTRDEAWADAADGEARLDKPIVAGKLIETVKTYLERNRSV